MKLTRNAVRKWLAALPPRSIAGEPFICADCVLAKYLNANGHHDAAIEYKHYFVDGDKQKIPMPFWAEIFQYRMNHAGYDIYGKRVTAARALKILDGI